MRKLALFLAFLGACQAPQALSANAISHLSSYKEISTMTPSEVFLSQEALLSQMSESYPVDAKIVWKPCGEFNSFFDPDTKEITLCTEMSEYPNVALFFAAHEMGHAIADEYTGTSEEIDADEIAALALIAFDHQDAVLDMALYFKGEATQAHTPGDPHPGHGFRAWYLACLESGSEGTPKECVELYHAVNMKWANRLRDYVKPLHLLNLTQIKL